MRRLRTINETVRFLKEQDPDTSLTPYFIRRMIVDGQVPTVMAGKKYLVDLDALLIFLDEKIFEKSTTNAPHQGIIRQLPERIR
ncbi:MAG: hypothetical protein EOM62_08110 [Bacteroidia bacterium]|nr:hypothetical protein [Bacteroidia bacterium]